MVTIRSQHFCSPSPALPDDRFLDLLDVKPVVAPDEAIEPILAWGTTIRSHILWVRSFDEMEKETQGGDQYKFF
jgi:hypothetical protein